MSSRPITSSRTLSVKPTCLNESFTHTDGVMAVDFGNGKIVQLHDAGANFRTGVLVWLSLRPEPTELVAPCSGKSSSNDPHGKINAAGLSRRVCGVRSRCGGNDPRSPCRQLESHCAAPTWRRCHAKFCAGDMHCLVRPGNARRL